MKNKKLSQGQSLIEVVAALSVVILVITALAIVVTLSIANAKFSQNQVLASKYSQEVMEKLRAYRDRYGWKDFTDNCDDSETNAKLGLSSRPPIISIFTVECGSCSVANDTCAVVVTAGWTDAKGRVHASRLETNFTNWRE